MIRRIIEVALLAVIFGFIACFTMIMVSPVLEERLFPKPLNEVILTEESPTYISEEVQPEDMLLEEQIYNENENDSEVALFNMAYLLRKTALSCQRWLVQVTGVSSEISWLESTKTSSDIATGAIIADNGTELLILVEGKHLEKADRIAVIFFDNSSADGVIKGKDESSELLVVAVEKNALSEDTLQECQVAELASSNQKGIVSSIVMAVGNPNGVAGSVNYGFITATGITVSSWDCNYKLIKTDIYGSSNPNGFLVNLKGQILGVLCNDYNPTDTRNLVTAVGISDLKEKIERMSNQEKIPMLGIKSTDVTVQAHKQNNIPYGAYITNVKLNSPAMRAGIQAGDIIVKLGETDIASANALSSYLYQLEAGKSVTVVIMRQSQGVYKERILSLPLGSQ